MRAGDRQGTSPGSAWFVRHADWALFVAGGVALAGGLLTQQDTAVTMLLILVVAALLLTGALLPRLSGTIKVSPAGIELQVLERLESTRAEAERVAPDRVAEALHRAYIELRPFLTTTSGLAADADSRDEDGEPPRGQAAATDDRDAIAQPAESRHAKPVERPDRTCPQCGQLNKVENLFCRECGRLLWRDEEKPKRPTDAGDLVAEARPRPVGAAQPAPGSADTRPPPSRAARSAPASADTRNVARTSPVSESALAEPPRAFARRILSAVQTGTQADGNGDNDA